MRYVSTRGRAPLVGFTDQLLDGLAPDGGLYLPERFPSMADIGSAADYTDAAVRITLPFVESDIPEDDWGVLLENAYRRFESPEVTPLVDIGNDHFLLELFHGPTLAFKDIAMQVLGDLFEYELKRRATSVTVIGATSGDTGAAAVQALADRQGIELFMLFPDGGISEAQRRQMTTCQAANVHNLAVDGSFDDCQDLVKAMFGDDAFRTRHRLSAVNSINWARVMMQVVYYAVAVARLGRPVTFSVPTGNFGNVYAGHVARSMGADINGLIIASNRNDILTRFHKESVMEIREVVRTTSPSMDIQVSSNLERFVFEALGRDGSATEAFMTGFRSHRSISDLKVADAYRDAFSAAMVTDGEGSRVIADLAARLNVVIDPHTAIGVGAVDKIEAKGTVVTLATAHPAKFSDAIAAATGEEPGVPDRLRAALESPETFQSVPRDLETVKSIVARSRQEF